MVDVKQTCAHKDRCVFNCASFTDEKHLCKANATSILCPVNLLKESDRLELVAEKGTNEYYHVTGTNTCIMHVEQDFCIILDYLIKPYNEVQECRLPAMLAAQEYKIYQQKSRDWVKTSNEGSVIGHIIQNIVHGPGAVNARKSGMTLDHGAETHNEKLVNCCFKYNNVNDGSHRKRKDIETQDDLNNYIDKVIAQGETPGYII